MDRNQPNEPRLVPVRHTYQRRQLTDLGPSLRDLCINAGLDPPDTPTQLEEMLVSFVHVQVQIYKVRGQQSKYAGHTCLFPLDSAKVVTSLPSAVSTLDIVILRSKPSPDNNDIIRNRAEFRVSRSRVLANLKALIRFHPDYRDIQIDYETLDTLPENDTILDQLKSLDIQSDEADEPNEASDALDAQDNVADRLSHFVQAMIPNVEGPDESEDLLIRRALEDSSVPLILTQPHIGTQPYFELDTRLKLFVKAFPLLFPSGQADYHEMNRPYKVKFHEWVEHLMKYDDGRFARHPRFR